MKFQNGSVSKISFWQNSLNEPVVHPALLGDKSLCVPGCRLGPFISFLLWRIC